MDLGAMCERRQSVSRTTEYLFALTTDNLLRLFAHTLHEDDLLPENRVHADIREALLGAAQVGGASAGLTAPRPRETRRPSAADIFRGVFSSSRRGSKDDSKGHEGTQ